MIDIPCLGAVGSGRRCHERVDQERGGAWCPVHRPEDFTTRPVDPVVLDAAAPRLVHKVGHADLALALRETCGSIPETARRLGVSRQAIDERLRRSEILREIRGVAMRGAP